MNVSVGGTLNHNTNQSYLLPVSSNTLFFFSGVLDYYSLLEIQELPDRLGETVRSDELENLLFLYWVHRLGHLGWTTPAIRSQD